ncbi:uncharacterized protein LOC143376303 [Andrena cerasifolii]|uniref:uncharacterized protein LOC143376303 n=1 Tax=Andrena cerasifolii TaxID=2819439 RepID=UPI0040377218
MKISLLFLFLQFLILIVVSQPVNKLIDIDNTSGNIVNNQVRRCRRTLRPPTPTCRINQYFDEEEGRCLGIAGGGKALFIDNTRSCGTNVLKPHCTNPKYYYVCKRKKLILVQCTQGYHFENRLQKCVHVGDRAPTSNTVQPNVEMPESIEVPACQAPGSFPVPGDCTLFYTCESTGHRLLQNIFKCPQGMVFDEEIEMCIPSVTCIQLKSNLFLPPCTTDAGRNVTVLPDRDETGKIQDSMSEEDYSEGKKKPTICETIFTDGYTEEIATTTNNYEGTETMYDEEKFSTTTLSDTEALIQQTPQEFVVLPDNSDMTTSTEGPAETSRSLPAIAALTTVTYSTMIKDDVEGLKEINSSTEMATSESSVETSTVEEVTSSEQNDPIVGEIEISGTTEGNSFTQTGIRKPSFETSILQQFTSSEQNDPIVGEIEISSTTEETSSTQTGIREPSFETSTLEQFTSSEQNDPIVGQIHISSTTEESSFTQMGTSEPSIETSTLEQFTLSEQNDPIVGQIHISSTTEESSFTQTGAREPSFETSTLEEFTSSDQNDPIVGEIRVSSTTQKSSFTQTGASEPSFETSTLEEFTSSDQNDPIVGEIGVSSTTEETSSTQTGVSEPSFETSTLEQFTSSELNDPIVGQIHISSTTEESSFTQTGASEPSFETSTLEEFTPSDQNDQIVEEIRVSSTTQKSSFTQTGASEPSFETSTLEEFTPSDQNDPIVGEIGVSSTTQETSSTQTGTSGSLLETSTLKEFISNKEYKPTGADEGVVNSIEGETTEHLTTETESTETTPTMSSTNLFTSTHSNSSNEDMTTESTVLLNDAFLSMEDLPDTNDEITKSDVESTTHTFVSTENAFALNDMMTTDATIPTSVAVQLSLGTDNITTENNTEITGEMFVPTESTPTSNKIATIDASVSSSKNDNITTEASAENTSQPSTPQVYKILDTVVETTTTSMESSTESAVTDELLESGYIQNTSPDFAFSTSTEAASLSSTVSVESFDNKINELVGNMEEFRYISTATPDIASSSEAELMNDISSDTPPDVEAYNKTVGQIVQFMNDITLALNAALSTETTVLKDDESSSTAMPDIGALNETVGAIQQLMNNFSSTVNSIASLEPEVRAKYNKENKALPIYIPIYDYTKKGGNIDNDDKNILANVCAMLTTSPVENTTETDAAATRELSNKTETQDLLNIDTMSKPKSNVSTETAIPSQTTLLRQNESAVKVTDPRRTISKHIVLPLTSSVLNITDKFERRLHDILRNLSKRKIRS